MNLDNLVIPPKVAVKFIQKKFYNKYIYKLEFDIPPKDSGTAKITYPYYVRHANSQTRYKSQQLANTIERLITDKDTRFRIEYNSVSFFTNCEQDVIELIKNKNLDKLTAVYRPISDQHVSTIEFNKRIRVRNSLFDNRFRYKVYLCNVYRLKETQFADIKAWVEVTENPNGDRWGVNTNLRRYLELNPGDSGRGIGWTVAVFLHDPEDVMMFQLKFHNYISYIEEAVLLSEV
jgi:hypothetical protein